MVLIFFQSISEQSEGFAASRPRCGVLGPKNRNHVTNQLPPPNFPGSNLSRRDQRKENDWSRGYSFRLFE